MSETRLLVIGGGLAGLSAGCYAPAFLGLYEELGIVPTVALRPLDEFATYRHIREN